MAPDIKPMLKNFWGLRYLFEGGSEFGGKGGVLVSWTFFGQKIGFIIRLQATCCPWKAYLV